MALEAIQAQAGHRSIESTKLSAPRHRLAADDERRRVAVRGGAVADGRSQALQEGRECEAVIWKTLLVAEHSFRRLDVPEPSGGRRGRRYVNGKRAKRRTDKAAADLEIPHILTRPRHQIEAPGPSTPTTGTGDTTGKSRPWRRPGRRRCRRWTGRTGPGRDRRDGGWGDGDRKGTGLFPMSASTTSADVRRGNKNSGCTVEPARPVGPRAIRIHITRHGGRRQSTGRRTECAVTWARRRAIGAVSRA